MKQVFAKFLKDESAASLVEYVLIAALVSIAATLALTAIGTNARARLNEAATDMASRNGP